MKVKPRIGGRVAPGPEHAPIQTSRPIEAAGIRQAAAVAARERRRLNARLTALQAKLKVLQQENADLQNTIIVLNANLELLKSNRVAWIYVQ
jgi:hypothetical protein